MDYVGGEYMTKRSELSIDVGKLALIGKEYVTLAPQRRKAVACGEDKVYVNSEVSDRGIDRTIIKFVTKVAEDGMWHATSNEIPLGMLIDLDNVPYLLSFINIIPQNSLELQTCHCPPRTARILEDGSYDYDHFADYCTVYRKRGTDSFLIYAVGFLAFAVPITELVKYTAYDGSHHKYLYDTLTKKARSCNIGYIEQDYASSLADVPWAYRILSSDIEFLRRWGTLAECMRQAVGTRNTSSERISEKSTLMAPCIGSAYRGVRGAIYHNFCRF